MITAIFDLDGTIADTLQDLADAVNYGLRELGCPEHPVESYKKMVGNGAQKLCRRALPEDKKELSVQLHELFRKYYEVHYLDNTRLYDGIYETVCKLADSGVIVAVATNKPQNVAREVVSKLLPDVKFSSVLGGCDERPKKPSPDIIREILSALPCEDNIGYMIGDSNVDIQTAKNSDLIPIGCEWGFRGADELRAEGAELIASCPADIVRFILGDT